MVSLELDCRIRVFLILGISGTHTSDVISLSIEICIIVRDTSQRGMNIVYTYDENI